MVCEDRLSVVVKLPTVTDNAKDSAANTLIADGQLVLSVGHCAGVSSLSLQRSIALAVEKDGKTKVY